MAIEPIKKIIIIAHNSLQEQVVDTLTRAGTVHVERIEDSDLLSSKELTEEEAAAVRLCSFDVSKVEFLLGFLKSHSGERPGFLKTMIKDKYPMTIDEFLSAAEQIDLGRFYAECSELQTWLIRLSDRKSQYEQETDELLNWTELEMPLDEVKGVPDFGLLTVRIALAEFETFAAELEREAPESSVELISEQGIWSSCLLLYHPDVEEAVGRVLSRHRHSVVTLPEIPDEPQGRMEQLARELTGIERRCGKLLDSAREYVKYVPDLEVLREFLLSRRDGIEVTTSFGATEATVTIEGWVTEERVAGTAETLERVSEDLVVEISDPGEDENPPVSLRNPGWVRPFETLVKLFGSPNNREYDPTWLVAISFIIFFGFCIGDVGYGLCLIAAFLLMKRHLPLGGKAKDLLTALIYGSAAAVVLGVLTGSWFGIATEELPDVLRSVAVLDPLRTPGQTMLVMGVCIGIGIIHMLAGTAVEFRDNWRAGNKIDALIDQGLIFLLFIGGAVAAGLAASKLIPVSGVFMVCGVAILGMLLLLGRGAKSIPGKVANGLYETYGTVVGFISDAISYVRLFALGLATFIIALVINTMAGMVKGIAPVFGILLMLLILVVGHTFNVAINLLGAFVHPLRLEFVEFFGKFYEDGGREFAPFGVNSKIVILKEDEEA